MVRPLSDLFLLTE